MSYEIINEYDKVSTTHFEEKKRYDLIIKREKEKLEPDLSVIKEAKEQSKHYKDLHEKYDTLAYVQMTLVKADASILYLNQVSKERTRAMRSLRYYHYRDWHTASLADKERWGIDLVKEALKRSKNPVLSCSFGIDSIVTLYITRKALVELGRDPSDIQVIWNDTLNEFPEVRIYANQLRKDWNLNLIISKPKIPLKKVIEKHGGVDSSYFFTRKGDRRNGQPLSEKCCGTLKHEPMKRSIKENNWDLVINGLRSDESTQRLRAGLRDGEYFYSSTEWKAFTCRPIMWMKEEDIWDYVKQENIPYNELYNMNTIMKYPDNNQEIIHNNESKLIEYEIDIEKLKQEQLLNVSRKQSILLKKLGYDIFTPRTGCMMCPIPVRHGYMQWMRLNYPKIFNSMVHSLGYGKALITMIPKEVKEEIEFVMGIELTEENAHEFLKDILQAKPCALDRFN
jgi:3'-phosphoadenosine 5'-phosphosulfate sulfotransferase (PAPS reductase)/FAD synthetase